MAKTQQQKIQDRKRGREDAADVLFVLREALLDLRDEDSLDAFWDTIYRAFPDELAKPIPLKEFKPMTDDESSIFGQRTMRFGKFSGMKIDQIDKGYLEWFANQPDDFKEDLQRYLASDRVKRENQ